MKTQTWFGTMSIKKENMYEAIKNSVELGYYGIDTAFIYGNEEVVGDVLVKLASEGIKVRTQTKIWPEHYAQTKEYFEIAMKKLKQEKIYSLMLHRPTIDFNLTIKAWKDLIEIKESGRVEEIGVSNMDKDMIEILYKETGVYPKMNQIEMSVTNFRHDRLFYCHLKGIEIQAWSPMGKDVPKNLSNELVVSLAKKHNCSPAQILLSFDACQGINPVSAGHTREQMEQNIKYVELSKDEIKQLMEMNIYDNRFEETFPY